MQRHTLVSIFCLIFAPVLYAQTPEQKKATVKYLQELQCPDGGFHPQAVDPRLDQAPKGSLRATTSALRALKYFGGTPKDASGAASFVKSCYDSQSGSFSDQPGANPDVFTTAVGLMVATELISVRPKAAAGGFFEGRTWPLRGVDWLQKNAKEFE